MLSWFTRKKPEVADLESIDLNPTIVLPEKTRRELYDAAVAEVQERRVQELILRELTEISIDPRVRKDTSAARAITGNRLVDREYKNTIKIKHPYASFKNVTNGYLAELPHPSIETLSKVLAKQYLSE